MTRKCRGCGQVHDTPRVIQAIPQRSVDDDYQLPRWAGTAIVALVFLFVALFNGLVPAIVRWLP
jgi:hypothetical protein